jgi:hypothetical protein
MPARARVVAAGRARAEPRACTMAVSRARSGPHPYHGFWPRSCRALPMPWLLAKLAPWPLAMLAPTPATTRTMAVDSSRIWLLPRSRLAPPTPLREAPPTPLKEQVPGTPHARSPGRRKAEVRGGEEGGSDRDLGSSRIEREWGDKS